MEDLELIDVYESSVCLISFVNFLSSRNFFFMPGVIIFLNDFLAIGVMNLERAFLFLKCLFDYSIKILGTSWNPDFLFTLYNL